MLRLWRESTGATPLGVHSPDRASRGLHRFRPGTIGQTAGCGVGCGTGCAGCDVLPRAAGVRAHTTDVPP